MWIIAKLHVCNAFLSSLFYFFLSFFLPSFDYPFHFMAPFLAMVELKQALFLLIWLNENVCKNVTNKKRPPKR